MAFLLVTSLALSPAISRAAGRRPPPPPGRASPRASRATGSSPTTAGKVPSAKLVPTVTPARLSKHAKMDAHAIRWCNLMGMPFVMDSGRPIDIREGPTAIMIAAENVPNPRYLYKNRATHISPDVVRSVDLGGLDCALGGDHAHRGYDRVSSGARNHHDPRRRIPHR